MKCLPTGDIRSYGRCDCTDNFSIQVLSDTGNFSRSFILGYHYNSWGLNRERSGQWKWKWWNMVFWARSKILRCSLIDRWLRYRFAGENVGHVRLYISSESLCCGGIPADISWGVSEKQYFAFPTFLFSLTFWSGWKQVLPCSLKRWVTGSLQPFPSREKGQPPKSPPKWASGVQISWKQLNGNLSWLYQSI